MVEYSVLKLALGYEYVEEELINNKICKVLKSVPASEEAVKLWDETCNTSDEEVSTDMLKCRKIEIKQMILDCIKESIR